MKLLNFYFGVVLVSGISGVGMAQNTVTTLSAAQLPKEVSYEGNLKSAQQWSDLAGKHIVVLSETGIVQNPKFTHENDGSDAELFAYHFVKEGAVFVQTWKVYDFIKDCPLDLAASFVENAFTVTDLNKDGISEIWVMYKTVCHGDVSPSDMKIIMYQGQQKYAMRGQNKVEVAPNEYYGGAYKFDLAFNQAPKAFRTFALTLWNKHLLQKYGN